MSPAHPSCPRDQEGRGLLLSAFPPAASGGAPRAGGQGGRGEPHVGSPPASLGRALGTREQAVPPSQRHSAARAGWAAPRWVLNARGAEARAFISQQRLLQSRRAAAAGEQRWAGQTCSRTPGAHALAAEAGAVQGGKQTDSRARPQPGRARRGEGAREEGAWEEGAQEEGRALGSGGEPSQAR